MKQGLKKGVSGIALLSIVLAGCGTSIDEYQLDASTIDSKDMDQFWVAKDPNNKMVQAMAGLACLGPIISLTQNFVDAYNEQGSIKGAETVVMQEVMSKDKGEQDMPASATITISENEIGWKSTDLKLQMPNGVSKLTPFPEFEASLALTEFNGHTVLQFDTKDVVCNIPVVKI